MSENELLKRGWVVDRNNQDRVTNDDGRVLVRKENRRWYLDKKRLFPSLIDSVIKADEEKRGETLVGEVSA
jgi:hypothetical protein